MQWWLILAGSIPYSSRLWVRIRSAVFCQFLNSFVVRPLLFVGHILFLQAAKRDGRRGHECLLIRPERRRDASSHQQDTSGTSLYRTGVKNSSTPALSSIRRPLDGMRAHYILCGSERDKFGQTACSFRDSGVYAETLQQVPCRYCMFYQNRGFASKKMSFMPAVN